VRILVVGAGVIGSVYAGKLVTAGHEVVLLARGRRLVDLQASGLILEDAQSGKRIALPVTAVAALDSADRYDLVLVPVRSEQLTSTLPVLSSMRDGSDVLFFGNTAGRQAQLVEALGRRVLFGFPAAGGTREGSVVRYELISQQQTMLGEPNGATTSRTRHLKTMLQDAGFPTDHHRQHGRLAAGTRRVRRPDRLRPLPGQHRRLPARRRPGHPAADGACHPASVPSATH